MIDKIDGNTIIPPAINNEQPNAEPQHPLYQTLNLADIYQEAPATPQISNNSIDNNVAYTPKPAYMPANYNTLTKKNDSVTGFLQSNFGKIAAFTLIFIAAGLLYHKYGRNNPNPVEKAINDNTGKTVTHNCNLNVNVKTEKTQVNKTATEERLFSRLKNNVNKMYNSAKEMATCSYKRIKNGTVRIWNKTKNAVCKDKKQPTIKGQTLDNKL